MKLKSLNLTVTEADWNRFRSMQKESGLRVWKLFQKMLDYYEGYQEYKEKK